MLSYFSDRGLFMPLLDENRSRAKVALRPDSDQLDLVAQPAGLMFSAIPISGGAQGSAPGPRSTDAASYT